MSSFKYQCLRCNAKLKYKTFLLRKPIDLVECKLCGVKYDYYCLVDADPERWERVRLRNLYETKENENGTILTHTGLGSK